MFFLSGGANLNPSDMLACLQQEKKDRLLLQEEQQLARLEEAARADEELGIVSGTHLKSHMHYPTALIEMCL